MKTVWRDVLTSIFMGMVLPGLVINTVAAVMGNLPEQPSFAQTPAELPSPAREILLRHSDGTTEPRELERYLAEVILAEMPVDFDREALKAQAVAARTYTCKAQLTGGKHGDGSVCTNPACCQGYISEESYLERGGSPEGTEKVRTAVLETAGEVLTYEGELIEATYFSCSGGATEDAVAVWGVSFPYLKSVESPGEEEAAGFSECTVFAPEEFCRLLGVSLAGAPEEWLGEAAYTQGGGVAYLTVGGERYAGTLLRARLGLRSTAFTAEATASEILFTTRGYGHRVGMSQYGANAMAGAGKSYRQILFHYYPGTALAALDRMLPWEETDTDRTAAGG